MFADLRDSAAAAGKAAPRGWKLRRQPDGVLAFHRATGLNVLFDELAVSPSAVDKFPRYVQLSLLDACNLSCGFCYANKQGHRWGVEELIELARGLDRWGVLELALAGGEPFAFPGLDELLVELWQSTRLAVHLTTNGLLVPDDFASKLSGRVGQVRVSVDGLGATYERLRGASFKRVEEGLDRLRGLNVALNTLVTRETLGELDALVDFALARGIRDLLLLKPHSGAEALLPPGFEPALCRTIERARRSGARVQLSCNFGNPGVNLLFPAHPCGSGRDFVYVTSDSRVKASSTARESFGFSGADELRAIYEARFFEPDPLRPLCRAGCAVPA